jgi:hypothetical protein
LRVSPAVRFLILSFLFLSLSVAQSPNGTISGIVHDPSDRPIPDAEIIIVNDLTNIQHQTKTSDEGIYVVTNLPPGPYRIQVTKRGFKTLIKPGLILNVQNALSVSITLPLGAVSEVITVEAGAPLINTENASVSTVIDRQFAENLPMNGRSFQTLIQLAPGVVVVPSTSDDTGQFSVNGQRPSSNYWMVDGVSANIGTSAHFQGNGVSGAAASFNAFGGTNSLVSVDAMQEFRIQTSTFAPEFGRTPGAQISIVTRSGSNRFHGTAFEYFRNDALDANDWFADEESLTKPEERQNDFGGTFSGPIVKDRTFFFFSYEGLRLRLPETALTSVPDVTARQNAVPAMQPYLNAFPLPNGTDNVTTGIAQFNASFSNRASMDAYSLRVDHKVNSKLSLFGRYNYSPSEIVSRGTSGSALNELSPANITTQTGTFGTSWTISPVTVNDVRFNYSRVEASSRFVLDSFGGGSPPASLGLPSPYTGNDASVFVGILSLAAGQYESGKSVSNLQRQINLTDSLATQKGPHDLKFGVDFRMLAPVFSPALYGQAAFFSDVPSAESGTLEFGLVSASARATLLFRNLGVFGQDTWRISPRLTMTYGLRWDVDLSPAAISGPNLPGVTGFSLNDFSGLAIGRTGAAPFQTTYTNFAPRVGGAYQLSTNPEWGTVFRGGFGVFYDLATQQTGTLIGQSGYPFGARSFLFGETFPFEPAAAAPPPIVQPSPTSPGVLTAFDPDLKLPYTLEWNLALEQSLGKEQSISVSYLGASGRRLIQSFLIIDPNASFTQADLVTNAGVSSYNAMQVQFQRRLTRGLQVLASYTWSHSIDDASEGSLGNGANFGVPGLQPSANRGPSDFDIRHAFSAAVSYSLVAPNTNAFGDAVLKGWSLESIIQARSAPPVNVFYGTLTELLDSETFVRPDSVPGQALYLSGKAYPGGKAFNPAAFQAPPTGANGVPLRQGNVGRNALRGFGATQWDFAAHRDFPLHETLKLQFRAELFNVLNHPNFGQPVGNLGSPALRNPQFGLSIETLAQSLNGGGSNLGGGAFNPLYQIGGPRSVQLALKLIF